MSAIVQTQTGPSAPIGADGLKPEWLKVNDATKIFGIGRSRLYELISEGRIKTASLRARGNVKGRRLISYDSLAEYIEGFVE
jgi:hypothetical protein